MKKQSAFDYDALGAWMGVIIFIGIPILMYIWFVPSNASESDEASRYENYKSEQVLNENGAQEACIDDMDRDVERYGEWVVDTYDC
jgi:hypothetical protein